ncbi:MAG: DUF4105 domain-containing protein [Sideroxydans sp.]|nr:DUF4105 domain-containing protein [Sideroxydans sp.]
MTLPHLILLVWLGCCAQIAWAAGEAAPDRLWQQAADMDLSRHAYWHKLLHYRQAALNDEVSSEIVAREFFLSPSGDHDPRQELQATLHAFFAPVGSDPDQHAQCRFVARYQWLREMLDWRGIAAPAVGCPGFGRWSAQGHVSSVSVIFASGYFSNPASYYGHLLLRFNTEQGTDTSGLLDQTLNFGAIVPEGEPGLVYVAKGIFGGYEAAFSSVQFYRHNHNYAEDELRDMWAYELSLSREDVARLVAHGWELLQARFDYYFANQNCAFRMSELLGLVVDEPILFESLPWSAPGSVFDHLVEIKYDGRPLVRKVTLIPSRLNRFHTQYRRLDGRQRELLQAWVDRPDTFSSAEYAGLEEEEKAAVIDALVDYVEFRRVREPADAFASSSKRNLLLERLKLPPRTHPEDGVAPHRMPPHAGPRPNLVRVGMLNNDSLGQGMSLILRPAYFDRMSLDEGRIPHATLSMFDIELVRFEQSLRLRRLDVVDLAHMNLSETPLPGDGGLAWRLRFGLESHNLSCQDCLVGQVTGGIGRAVSLTDRGMAYVMADAFTQTPYAGSGNLGMAFNAGAIIAPSPAWKSSLEIGQRRYLGGTYAHMPTVRWENRFGSRRDMDVRLNYEKRVAAQWQLAVSWYW